MEGIKRPEDCPHYPFCDHLCHTLLAGFAPAGKCVQEGPILPRDAVPICGQCERFTASSKER